MELGIYHEFPVLPGRSQAECFAAGFDIVDASEEYGLDVMWLAELHFDKRRALAARPLVLGTAIAARTERIRIGTSVQVLPLANPLRIAEEAATLDHVSKGRLIFGAGRSGVVKTYEALNIAYSESKDREIECLEAYLALAQDRPGLEDILPTMLMPCCLYTGEMDRIYPEVEACSRHIPQATFF